MKPKPKLIDPPGKTIKVLKLLGIENYNGWGFDSMIVEDTETKTKYEIIGGATSGDGYIYNGIDIIEHKD